MNHEHFVKVVKSLSSRVSDAFSLALDELATLDQYQPVVLGVSGTAPDSLIDELAEELQGSIVTVIRTTGSLWNSMHFFLQYPSYELGEGGLKAEDEVHEVRKLVQNALDKLSAKPGRGYARREVWISLQGFSAGEEAKFLSFLPAKHAAAVKVHNGQKNQNMPSFLIGLNSGIYELEADHSFYPAIRKAYQDYKASEQKKEPVMESVASAFGVEDKTPQYLTFDDLLVGVRLENGRVTPVFLTDPGVQILQMFNCSTAVIGLVGFSPQGITGIQALASRYSEVSNILVKDMKELDFADYLIVGLLEEADDLDWDDLLDERVLDTASSPEEAHALVARFFNALPVMVTGPFPGLSKLGIC